MPLPLPVIGKLLWRYRKWIAIALAVLGLIAGFMLYRHSLIERGREEVQALWDADELAEKAVADAQILDSQVKEAAAAARNKVLADEHAKEVAAAIADRDRVAGLLKQARDRARASAAAQNRDQPGAATASTDASPRPPDAEAELDGLIADVIAEHRANASQLNSLIGEILPQM